MATPETNALARIKPYRRFLTSAFHTRFVHATALVLLVCWDHAFWLSDKTKWLLWSWFPLGPAGIKTVLLYVSALCVFILHVATLRVGRLRTTSPFGTLRHLVCSLSTIQPFFWYTVSAVWFSEVYIWSAATSSNLGWVEPGGMTAPDKLNERPIYLRAYFLMLGIVQSCLFLLVGSYALELPNVRLRKSPDGERSTHSLPSFQQRLREDVPGIIIISASTSSILALLGPFVYTALFRQTLWRCHLAFAKLFWNLSRADARASGYPPSNLFLILRSLFAGFLLMMLWNSTTVLFGHLLRQEPTKKGIPLSAGSKDPNGTLLNGLKAKREIVKTFAFWELAIIAQTLPERRKAIFNDIERPSGTCWAQMLEAALDVVRQIDGRIAAANPAPEQAPQQQNGTAETKIQSLPSIALCVSDRPIYAKELTAKSPSKKALALAGAAARKLGQSPEPWNPPVDKVETTILEHAQPITNAMSQWWTIFESSPVGGFFKEIKVRKIEAVVLGSPYSQSAVIVDAIESVTKMLVASLSEDAYGKAVAGVPTAVRTFTKTINSIEVFVKSSGEGLEGDIEEVEIIAERLKAALAELLAAFQLYLADVGLGITELNEAKKAAEKKPLVERRQKIDAPQEQPAAEGGRERERPERLLSQKDTRREKVEQPKAIEQDSDVEEELGAGFGKPRRLFESRRRREPNDWLGNSMRIPEMEMVR